MDVTYDEAESVANMVQDDLMDLVTNYPGTSKEGIARAAYDAVMSALGHGEEDE